MVFDGHEKGDVNPASILNHFIDDEGNYREVAALFNASLEESLSNEEQKKAFSETVLRIKRTVWIIRSATPKGWTSCKN